MMQKALLHFQMPELTCAGLLLFFAVFAAALIWVFRKGSNGFYARVEALPLEDLKIISNPSQISRGDS